jgi:hypothetical protein
LVGGWWLGSFGLVMDIRCRGSSGQGHFYGYEVTDMSVLRTPYKWWYP